REGSLLKVKGGVAQVRVGNFYLLGPTVHLDQAANKAWVDGVGAMQVTTAPLTLHWNRRMFFDGKSAELEGGIQVQQGDARLSCPRRQVHFDRPLPLTPGPKGTEPVRIHHFVCDRDVRIEEHLGEGRLCSWQAPVVEVTAPEGGAKSGGLLHASGPGCVRVARP